MPHNSFGSKDDLKQKFWEQINFGRVPGGLVWRELAFFSKHPFRQVVVILQYSSFSSSLPSLK